MDVRARLAELLAERRHGFSLPREFYTDPAIHEADLQAIFYRRWLFAAASCELTVSPVRRATRYGRTKSVSRPNSATAVKPMTCVPIKSFEGTCFCGRRKTAQRTARSQ